MTLQQIELHPCSDSMRYEADQRIPNASLAFLDLQDKHNSSLPTDALQLVMAYDLAEQSFSGNNLEAWTGSVLNKWTMLCNVKKYHDDKNLAILQLLLTLQTKNGEWNNYFSHDYCTHFSDPMNFKVAAFMANVLEKLRLDTLAIQHRSKGKAQAAAHYGFGGGGNGDHNGVINGGKSNHGDRLLTIVMVAKDATKVILLLSLALNVKRNSTLAFSIALVAFLASKRVRPMLWLALQLAANLCRLNSMTNIKSRSLRARRLLLILLTFVPILTTILLRQYFHLILRMTPIPSRPLVLPRLMLLLLVVLK